MRIRRTKNDRMDSKELKDPAKTHLRNAIKYFISWVCVGRDIVACAIEGCDDVLFDCTHGDGWVITSCNFCERAGTPSHDISTQKAKTGLLAKDFLKFHKAELIAVLKDHCPDGLIELAYGNGEIQKRDRMAMRKAAEDIFSLLSPDTNARGILQIAERLLQNPPPPAAQHSATETDGDGVATTTTTNNGAASRKRPATSDPSDASKRPRTRKKIAVLPPSPASTVAYSPSPPSLRLLHPHAATSTAAYTLLLLLLRGGGGGGSGWAVAATAPVQDGVLRVQLQDPTGTPFVGFVFALPTPTTAAGAAAAPPPPPPRVDDDHGVDAPALLALDGLLYDVCNGIDFSPVTGHCEYLLDAAAAAVAAAATTAGANYNAYAAAADDIGGGDGLLGDRKDFHGFMPVASAEDQLLDLFGTGAGAGQDGNADWMEMAAYVNTNGWNCGSAA
ncbi:hypothetical protein DFJ73DRAFT_762646 [Zopfochytrium polystomum]|nr:hypothetical protein DFJ73DRAFT_762646 [Zopfochytrium polystomum]